jgi:hypothetical protein
MKKLIISGVLISILFSCSLEQRSERALRRAIRLNPSILTKDTINIQDTVFTEEIKYVKSGLFEKDTSITVINNKYVTLKYFYASKKDSLSHDITLKTDTIVKVVKVPYDRIIQQKKGFVDHYINYILLGFLLIVLIIIVFKK